MEKESKANIKEKYNRPSLDLLQAGVTPEAVENYHKDNTNAIIEKLKEFGIDVEFVNKVVGATVTQYQFKMLSRQIMMKKIEEYEADLRACVECEDNIRIEAPIPGTNLIGIEIPNKKKMLVTLRSLLTSPKLSEKKGALVFPVGQTFSGEVLAVDLAKLPHLLVGGAVGAGKSVFLHSMIVSLMYRYGPEYVRFVMIDPKFVELRRYNNTPHVLLQESINFPENYIKAFDYLIDEMEHRYKLFRETSTTSLASYNTKITQNGGKGLPYLVLVVDELADLMVYNGKVVEHKIQMLAQKSRAAGIHIVLCTQRPDVKTITEPIKACMQSRIAFRMSDQSNSYHLIGSGEAAKLVGRGDMLFINPEKAGFERVQAGYISDNELSDFTKYLIEHNVSYYDESIENQIKGSKVTTSVIDDQIDPAIKKALQYCIKKNDGVVSTEAIQKGLHIGRERASSIVESLVAFNIIKQVGESDDVMCYTVSSKPDEIDNRFPGMEDYLECDSHSFDKILGYKSIKEELVRLADTMTNPKHYSQLGASTPKGLLLYGDPGLGKTLMANCLIDAVGRHVYVCRKSKHNGAFVDEIKNVFEQAVQNQPSIVFLDDMDKFANEDEYHKNADEYVTIQSCIDEVKDKEVFVLATANGIRHLPDSLTRVGRFDRVIRVTCPKGKDAVEIIKYYLDQKQNVRNIDTDEIARIMTGCSCAELETVINEAAVFAGAARKSFIDMDDVIRACMRVIFRAPEELSDDENKYIRQIAYHEAGHAVIGEILEPNSINIVSVKKYSGDIGGVTSITSAEGYGLNYNLMENRILSLFGGRAATEIVFGAIDVGVRSDMRQICQIIDRFVDDYAAFGFDKYEGPAVGSEGLRERASVQRANEMERYYKRAKKLIVDNRDFLDALAEALVERKTLLRKDIAEIKAKCGMSV